MNDTTKQPAPFEPIPVGGPAAVLDIPRSAPAAPPPTRPTPPRQTQPVPAPPPAPSAPVVPRSPLPPDIAPEVPLSPAPNPIAGTPAPKASAFSGLLWDVLRPNRAKAAVLAGVASLAAGAFGLSLVFPPFGTSPPQSQAKVKLQIPTEEPTKTEKPPTTPPVTAPAPKPADGGWNPIEPPQPTPSGRGTGGIDLPPLLPDARQPTGHAGTTGPKMPGELTLPALPGEFPTPPSAVDPQLQRVSGTGGPAPAALPTLPPVGVPTPATPSGPAPLPPIPELQPPALPGAGSGTGQPLPPPGLPALPPVGSGPLPLPGPSGTTGDALPGLPGGLPTLPGGGNNPGGGNPAPAGPLSLPQPLDLKPLPIPGMPGEIKLQSTPAEVKPLDVKPAQPDLPPLGGGSLPPIGTPPPPPRLEPVERTGGVVTSPAPGVGFPTGGNPPGGSSAMLQPPVGETKTEYDVDLHRPRAGDTYATVSRSFYGNPQYAAALQAFNRNQPIERVAEVQVPPVHVIRKYAPARAADPVPDRDRFQPTRPATDDDPVWGPPGSAQGGPVVYTLFTVPRKGLTLKDVAKTYYGSERSWTKLNNARNPKFDPDEELPVGTQLQVPTESVPFR